MNAPTLPGLIDTLVAARHAGGFRYNSQERVLRQFAGHCRREGYADGSIVQEAVEEFLYGRHLKASTIRREEIVLRELAEHARQFGWQAWAPPTLTRVKTPHRPPPYVFSDDEIRRLFHVIDTQPLSEMSNRALVDPVLFRVFYTTGMRLSEALNLELRDFDPAHATIEVRDGKNHENRFLPVTGRLAATLETYIAAAHPHPESAHKLFHTGDPSKPADKSTVYNRFRRYLADADIPHFPGGPHIHSLRHGFAVQNLRRWAADGADLVVMLPYLSAYMGHADLRGTQYYLQLTADAYPEVAAMAAARFGYVIPSPVAPARTPAVSRVSPVGGDLAGRWLSKFLTSHLAGERDLSPQTIASYRDAIRLLLTWFRDVEGTPPEKLRLADLDRARVLCFLDWLQAERGNSAATRNQRLAVIKSFARYTAVERPEFLGQATQILAVKQKKTPAADMGHLTGDEVKALLAEPDPATRRGLRDTVLLSTLYDTAARVQEICDLNTSDVRVARPMVVTLRGKGSKTRRVPLMDPTARAGRGLPQPARAPPWRRRRRRPAVQRARTDPADPLGRHQNPRQARPIPAPPQPRLCGRRERHPARDQKDPGDAPAPSRSQPDLHTRPARPRRRVHNRDLRPRRRGRETQSHRERLPVAHPRAPGRLDGRPRSPRMARPRLPITPRIMWPEPARAAPPPAETPLPAT